MDIQPQMIHCHWHCNGSDVFAMACYCLIISNYLLHLIICIFSWIDPDPKISFEERQRLFNLPRSAWTDYNPELISKGGGISSHRQIY